MAKVYAFFIVALVCCAFTHTAYAADDAAPLADRDWQHALIMHGEPKYAVDFTHVDYANPEAPKGGTLNEVVVGSFDTLNHHIIQGEMARGLSLTSDRLMHRVWDEPFALYGLVAQEIKISENRDTIIFKLNPKARFHDGAPMTAEDVKFSYEMYRAHGHPVRRRVYGLVDEVRILGEREIMFRFGEGYDQETALILAIMPVLPRHYWQGEGRDITKTTLTPPLGSGPYKIDAVDPGRRIIYSRVPDYWGKDLPVNNGLYNFDIIEYSYFRDRDIAREAFKSGEANLIREFDIQSWMTDYASNRFDQGAYVMKKYDHKRPEKVKALIFNTRRPQFQDVRVRKALSAMFDFPRLNNLFFKGAFKRIASYFPNSELAHLDMVQGYVTEVDIRTRMRTARSWLNEAGYSVNDGVMMHDKTGEALSFEILLSSSADEKVALFYKNTLKRLGITVHIRTVDAAQFTGRLDQFDYDIVMYQWVNSLSPGAEQLNYWSSDAAKRNGSRNYAGVTDSRIDQLAGKIAQVKTRAELVEAARALDFALIDGFYSIPLWYIGSDLIAHTPDLKSTDYVPMYGTVLESWWSEKGLGNGTLSR